MSSLPQLSLLAYLVQNPDDYPALHPIFADTGYTFQNDALELLHVAVKDSWQRFECLPTQDQMKSWLYSKNLFQANPDKLKVITKAVDKVYTEELNGIDRQIVLGEILKSERQVLSERALKMDPHNFNEEATWLQRRLDVLHLISQRDNGQWAMPLDDKWISQPAQTLATYLGNPIPLGFPRIDFWLGGGGRRGELILPAALPEDGKTMFLVTLVCNLAKAGRRSYVAQCDNTFEEFIAKIWACLAGCSTDDLLNPTNHTQYKLAQVRKKYPNIHRLIVVRKWPRGTKTVADFKRDFLMFEKMLRPYDLAQGVPEKEAGLFDCVMGDYLDTFTAKRVHKEHRFGLDEVCKEFAGCCEEYEKLGVFPTQLNRTAKYIDVPDIDNLSEAFTKSHHAAVIPMFFASKADRMLGKSNIFWAKTRRLRGKFVTPMIKDVRTQTFIEDEQREIYYLDAVANNPKKTVEQEKAKLKKAKKEEPTEENNEFLNATKQIKERAAAV